jgi:hypothetical protein
MSEEFRGGLLEEALYPTTTTRSFASSGGGTGVNVNQNVWYPNPRPSSDVLLKRSTVTLVGRGDTSEILAPSLKPSSFCPSSVLDFNAWVTKRPEFSAAPYEFLYGSVVDFYRDGIHARLKKMPRIFGERTTSVSVHVLDRDEADLVFLAHGADPADSGPLFRRESELAPEKAVVDIVVWYCNGEYLGVPLATFQAWFRDYEAKSTSTSTTTTETKSLASYDTKSCLKYARVPLMDLLYDEADSMNDLFFNVDVRLSKA